MHTIVYGLTGQPGLIWFETFTEKGKAEKKFLGKFYKKCDYITHISKSGKIRNWKSGTSDTSN